MGKRRLCVFLCCVLCCLLLCGCKRELYSGLNEREANNMMEVLLRYGISCEKVPAKDNKWTLMVDSSVIPRALEILKAEGLPGPKFVTIGDMFQKKGLVSSPMEERVRYIYALSQELSQTISLIDGIIIAQVYIVLPKNDPFQEKIKPSSASVFLKCKRNVNTAVLIPKIKKLILNSIEGLTYDKITVVPFISNIPSETYRVKFISVMGIKISPDSRRSFYFLIFGLIAIIIILSGILFYFFGLPEIKKLKNKHERTAERSSSG